MTKWGNEVRYFLVLKRYVIFLQNVATVYYKEGQFLLKNEEGITQQDITMVKQGYFSKLHPP